MAKNADRSNFAWLYGAQARKDGKERAVPEYWMEQADPWLNGFDDVALGSAAKPQIDPDRLDAEIDEEAAGLNGNRSR